MPHHYEQIECPNCGHQQSAKVIHDGLSDTKAHTCENCEYGITEAEWDLVYESIYNEK